MLVLQSTTSSDCGGARYTTHDRERILVSKNVRKKEEKNQKTHEKLPHTHTHTHTKGRHHVPDFSPRISPPQRNWASTSNGRYRRWPRLEPRLPQQPSGETDGIVLRRLRVRTRRVVVGHWLGRSGQRMRPAFETSVWDQRFGHARREAHSCVV